MGIPVRREHNTQNGICRLVVNKKILSRSQLALPKAAYLRDLRLNLSNRYEDFKIPTRRHWINSINRHEGYLNSV